MNPEFELLTNLGSTAVQTAIKEYTRYKLISAVAWFSAFSALAIGSAKALSHLLKKNASNEDTCCSEDDTFVVLVCFTICTIIFFLGAVSNIPNIANPKAVAIHQLLIDARGK